MLKRIFCIASIVFVVLLTGCGTWRETMPARSAEEHFLLTTAADRAIEDLPAKVVYLKAVHLKTDSLVCLEKEYVIERVRKEILKKNGKLVSPEEAEVVLSVSSGGLSIDKVNNLLGVPELPIPVPGADSFKFPEIPIFKRVKYTGVAKLLFTAIDPKTKAQVADIPTCYGRSEDVFWWFLLFGPARFSDLPFQEVD